MNKKLFLLCALLLALSLLSGCGLLGGGEPAATPEPEATPMDPVRNLQNQGLSDGDLPALYADTYLVQIDLTGNDITPAGVTSLQANLPGCTVLWDVPVGAEKYPSNATEIILSDCTADDMQNLKYLPNLTHVDATACTDYAGVRAMAEAMPGCVFDWGVHIGETVYPPDTAELDLSGADTGDAAALAEALANLPALTAVDFGGRTLSREDMHLLVSACPAVRFRWTAELCGVPVSGDQAEADLSGKTVDMAALKADLPYLPWLTKVDMCGCGFTNEEMEALSGEFPNIKFVWMIQVGAWEMRTDVKAFSAGNLHSFEGGRYTGGSEVLDDEDVAPLKYCTELVALDLGHKRQITDISFVKNMKKLRFLIIAMEGISTLDPIASCTELEYLETFQNYVNDWTPFLSLPKLTHLNCSTNFVKDGKTSVYPDYKILLQMPQLQRLWIIRDGFTEEQIAEIKAALPDCVINTTGTHSTSNGWRDNDLYKEMQKLFNLAALD